jgi:predicted Zn-dependent protease
MTTRTRHRSLCLPVLLALVAACAEREPLPPLPEVALDGLGGPVARQMEESLAAARAADADASANGRLGMVLQAYVRLPAAEVAYRRARLLDPESFQWCYLHGVVLQALGSPVEAGAALIAALERRPGYVPAELRLAALAVETGQAEAARARYAAILERWPDSAAANLGLGRLLLAEGDAEAALEPLQIAARAAPDAGAVHYALAQAHAALGDTQAAETHTARFEAAETRDPPVSDPMLAAVNALNLGENNQFALALALLEQNRRAEAAEAFERVVAQAPDNYSARSNLIGLYGDLGRPDDSERHYRAALAIDPAQPTLHNNVGVVRLRKERYAEAAEAFREAIRLDPDYANAYRNLGRALELDGETDGALAQYRAALALRPEDRQVRFFLGRLLVTAGRPGEAIAELEAVLAPEDAHTPWYLRTLADAHYASGDTAAGDRTLAEARSLAVRYGQTRLVAEIDAREAG